MYVTAPVFLFLLLALAGPLGAQASLTQRAGKFEFTLRPPADGIFAQEEIEVGFRVTALAAGGEPVPVSSARFRCTVYMPSMPGMPKFEELAHSHGIVGEYGVHPTFPHGGEYRVRITMLSADESSAKSAPQGEPLTVEFPLQVEDASEESRQRPNALRSPYRLRVTTVPAEPKAGQETELRLVVTLVNTADQRAATEFERVHEKLMHLFVVRADLGQFAHEHPELKSDGVFVLRHTFPTGGSYRLFADLAPKNAGSQVLMESLTVAGSTGKRYDIYGASVGDRGLQQKVGNMALDIGAPKTPLPVRKTIVLAAKLQGAEGKPAADLQPYLGAMGHLFLINQDGETFVHSHPDDRTPVPAGSLPFLTRFPKPGLYRGWMQVQRDGKVHTADFIVQAE